MAKITFESLIIHEEEEYLIVNKPPFISSLEDRHDSVNILAMAKNYCSTAQLCHRLDKETSGALVIAKTPEAYRWMSRLFEKREIKKVYHAVVAGIHQLNDVEIDAPIYVGGKGTVKIDRGQGKASVTKVKTEKAFKAHTLMACYPESGRMHQIRIHLAHQNMPIVGDLSYGGEHFYLSSIKKNYYLKKDTEELPLIKRVALHAFQLHFVDLNNKNISVTAEYPKDFGVLIKQLEKNS